jgi:hypothetical protein
LIKRSVMQNRYKVKDLQPCTNLQPCLLLPFSKSSMAIVATKLFTSSCLVELDCESRYFLSMELPENGNS